MTSRRHQLPTPHHHATTMTLRHQPSSHITTSVHHATTTMAGMTTPVVHTAPPRNDNDRRHQLSTSRWQDGASRWQRPKTRRTTCLGPLVCLIFMFSFVLIILQPFFLEYLYFYETTTARLWMAVRITQPKRCVSSFSLIVSFLFFFHFLYTITFFLEYYATSTTWQPHHHVPPHLDVMTWRCGNHATSRPGTSSTPFHHDAAVSRHLVSFLRFVSSLLLLIFLLYDNYYLNGTTMVYPTSEFTTRHHGWCSGNFFIVSLIFIGGRLRVLFGFFII